MVIVGVSVIVGVMDGVIVIVGVKVAVVVGVSVANKLLMGLFPPRVAPTTRAIPIRSKSAAIP